MRELKTVILRRHVASGKLLRSTSQFLVYLRLLIHGKICRLVAPEIWRRICFHISVKTSRNIYVPRNLCYQKLPSRW
ncbi:TRF-like 10 [Zea mays]|uniref:TRF-like 10 n=1 Tax=Zea mays TaxID=4577 RepID=A0A1D6GCN2_MAIZE|nr:TRF-like 10 [Zea mays]